MGAWGVGVTAILYTVVEMLACLRFVPFVFATGRLAFVSITFAKGRFRRAYEEVRAELRPTLRI